MGWLSKIFKVSSHKVCKGHYDSRYRSKAIEHHQSNSLDSCSETEDKHPIIASPASDEEHRREIDIGSEQNQEEDENEIPTEETHQYNNSSNAESPPHSWNINHNGLGYGYAYGYGYGYPSESFYEPISSTYSTSFRVCAGCNVDIGHGRFLSCMSALWHPECFRCRGCNHPISDYEFSVSESQPYHKACYRESHHPKCDICKNFIPTNTAGLVEYRAHPFWSQKYCPKHEHDGTLRCCSCERMQSHDARFAALNDGRSLCLECLDSAIMTSLECEPLYLEIQKFFEGLNMKLKQKVPLHLVEKQALNEAIGGEKHGHHHMAETRGICLSKEQVVSTIPRRPRKGTSSRVTDMRTEPYKLKRHCEVTAIVILYGLPRLVTGIILAHEMMHAWLRLKGYQSLRQDVEEGICQVIANMWLESQVCSLSDRKSSASSNSKSRFEKKLGRFLKKQIATDTSVVYGKGFRAANRAVIKFGLEKTLDYMRETGKFPR